MKRSVILSIAIGMALLLPVVATAAVVVNSNINVQVTPDHSNPVYITEGPGYRIANESGFISFSGNNEQYTNASVVIHSIPGSGYIAMTNVLEVYNDSAATSPVYVWLNASAPSGVTIYYSQTQMTFSGSSISGSKLSGSSGPIQLSGAGADLYLSFMISDSSVTSFTLAMQFQD